MLQQRVPPAAAPSLAAFRSPAAGALRTFFLDHQLQGRVFMSFTAYLETMRAARSAVSAVTAGVGVRDVFYLQPLVLADTPTLWMECKLQTSVQAEVRSFDTGEHLAHPGAPHLLNSPGT